MPSGVSHMMTDVQCLLFILMKAEDFQTGEARVCYFNATMCNKEKRKGKVVLTDLILYFSIVILSPNWLSI